MSGILFPLVAVAGIALLLTFVGQRLSPVVAATTAMLTLITGATTTIPVIFHLSMSWLVSMPDVGPLVHNALHRSGVHLLPQTWLVVVAPMFVAVAVVRTTYVVACHRRLRRGCGGEVHTIPDTEIFAFALPGPGGDIVLSQGLKNALTRKELDVVLAHERSHVVNRHDLWLLAGRICVAINPLFVRSFSMLRCALERAADADAVRVCGDRRLVAQTIAKVALGSSRRHHVLGAATFGVSARVRELIDVDSGRDRWITLLSVTGVISGAALCIFQWKRVIDAVATMCGV